jgi:glycosyltransferase involved in cell wall biosynthesis
MNKVAIWMPVYNEARYLDNTINSVMSQTYKNIDLYISDNHSDDGSREIIEKYIAVHPNIYLWAPPNHCSGTDHLIFMWERIKTLDYDYFFHIGGHDLLDNRYVETLEAASNGNRSVSICCGRAIALDRNNNLLGEYSGKTPTLLGPYTVFNPASVIALTSSNAAIHGLIPAHIARRVGFRYKCPALDVLFVAEISSYGDVVYCQDAVLYQRSSGTSSAEYLLKHMGVSAGDQEAITELMDMQFRYVSEIADVISMPLPKSVRGVYKSALLALYFVKWCSKDYESGALKHVGLSVENFLDAMNLASAKI